MSDTPLTIAVEGPVATLTMNRPEALNALSGALRRALIAALDRFAGDEAIRAVILTGAGRAFTAGLDLKEMSQSGSDVSAHVDAENVVAAIERFPKPLIAAVNGLAYTGGLEITLACDIVLASEDAVFADTHVKLGVTPGWGLSQRLSRRIGVHRAKELSFSARPFAAAEAHDWGLVNHVYPAAQLMAHAQELAGAIARWDGAGLRAMKAMIDDGLAMPLGEALRWEAATASRNNAAVRLDAAKLPLRPARA